MKAFELCRLLAVGFVTGVAAGIILAGRGTTPVDTEAVELEKRNAELVGENYRLRAELAGLNVKACRDLTISKTVTSERGKNE